MRSGSLKDLHVGIHCKSERRTLLKGNKRRIPADLADIEQVDMMIENSKDHIDILGD